MPTDVNWTVLSYLIAHLLCLSPCVHPWLIRNFSYAINAVWSCQSREEHALFQILNIQLCGVCKCVLPLNGDAPSSHLGHFPCPAQISPRYLSGLSVPIPEVRETVTLWCICFLLTCTSSSCLTTMKPEELHRFGSLSSAGSFCPLPVRLQWPYSEAVGQLTASNEVKDWDNKRHQVKGSTWAGSDLCKDIFMGQRCSPLWRRCSAIYGISSVPSSLGMFIWALLYSKCQLSGS